jgi:hypothetical protein
MSSILSWRLTASGTSLKTVTMRLNEVDDAALRARSGSLNNFPSPGQSPPSAMQSESGLCPRHRRSPRGVDARRPLRGSARRGYGIRAPGTEREPGTASSAAPGPAQHQVSAARWIASRKLPNRRRIVFSDGRMPASVQLAAVGSEPCSATNLRRAASVQEYRVISRIVHENRAAGRCRRVGWVVLRPHPLPGPRLIGRPTGRFD